MVRAASSDVLVLALDVGTSSCRASLYDSSGQALPGIGSHIRYAPTVTDDGGAVMDPDHLLGQIVLSVDQLVAQAGTAMDRVAAVAISTFWHSLVGLDGSNRPLTPLYLWMDARSREDAETLKERLDERDVHGRTGCVLHWSYLPATLVWLHRVYPETFERVKRWVSIGEYLALQLFGCTAVSVSMASGTGIFNQHTLTWDRTVLEALPIDPDQLSPIVSHREPFSGLRAEFASRWPALRSVPWLPALGDGACSNLGAGCVRREQLCLMVGTSSVMRVLWRTDEVTIPWGVWCYRLDGHHPLIGGAMNDGGDLMLWLRSSFRLPGWREMEAAVAAMEPDSHGLTVLPLWAGERSPYWALDATGAIAGLRLDTSPIEVVRAVMEAVAIRFTLVQEIIHRVIPEAREIVASGGALLRSPAWMQIMADVLASPVHASSELEASSRGAALMALELLGKLPGGIEALRPSERRAFIPVPEHTARYRAAAERQARLYEKLIADS